MRYIIVILCIIFVIIDFAFTINPIIRNIILGSMSVFAIAYLVMNKSNNGLNKMFDKSSSNEKSSLFDIRELFKK